MNTNDKRQSGMPTPSKRTSPLKGSDFFPPGAGWNHADKPDESAEKNPADKRPDEHSRH
jgi:hypothetical protein